MGAIAAAAVHDSRRVRGVHPLNSFSAIGSMAARLVQAQTVEAVHEPLARLTELSGAVVLAGVGLTSMTLIHLAEERAGRRMFVRWGMLPEGVTAVRVGGCSAGFERLASAVAGYEQRTTVGRSPWRIFDAQTATASAAQAIESKPEITSCRSPTCERCRDAIQGGPES